MSELSGYVDELFSAYKNSHHIEELKAEILSNLEAKKADLLSSGLDEPEAVRKVKESITNIDFLIDSNSQVYINQLKLELAQWSLIMILIGWILTIPSLIFHSGLPANTIMFMAVLLAGSYYLVLYQKQAHTEGFTEKTEFRNVRRYQKRRRVAWILWIVFAAVSLLAITALHFGSNLWFARRATIDGPYALASLLIAYFEPMLTIIIPIIVSLPVSLITKYEVGDSHEK